MDTIISLERKLGASMNELDTCLVAKRSGHYMKTNLNIDIKFDVAEAITAFSMLLLALSEIFKHT